MPKAKSHIPEGLRALQPQIVTTGAQKFLDFTKAAFRAEIGGVMHGPNGVIMHSFIRIADSTLFVSDAAAGFAKPTSSNLFLYVPDVDATVKAAVSAGAKVTTPVSDMFWGDRWGMVEDPFGNVWQLATHIEDISEEEMRKRAPKPGAP